jgi:transposase-like protein
MRVRRSEVWAKWEEIVAEQAGSGQSVAAFCRERGLGAAQLYVWKRRLRPSAAESFVELRLVGSGAQPAPARSGAIEIRLEGGRRVLVEPGFEASHLRAVLAALETEA